jgi:hypothetical protein
MLQARGSWVRCPMRSLDFSVDLILPSRIMALGSTQLLTELSARSLPGVKGWPEGKVNDLIAICELTV